MQCLRISTDTASQVTQKLEEDILASLEDELEAKQPAKKRGVRFGGDEDDDDEAESKKQDKEDELVQRSKQIGEAVKREGQAVLAALQAVQEEDVEQKKKIQESIQKAAALLAEQTVSNFGTHHNQ
mgnify:CR=1 FL=1